MKLTHPDILGKQIDFDTNMNYQLIIENSSEFLRLSSELYNQINGENGEFCLFEGAKELNIAKKSAFLYDYYNFSLNTKKIISEVNSAMVSALKNGDFSYDIATINTMIAELNNKLINSTMLPISFFTELNYENFVKFSDYEFDDTMPLPQKISTFIQMYAEIKDIKLVVLVNLFDYLEKDELKALIEDINYRDVHILFLSSHFICDLEETEKIIIDNDLCVI